MDTVNKGYKSLPFYIQSEIIYDFTVEFCQKYIDKNYNDYKSYKSYSRQSDQMIQAGRSGKQNIAEGYLEKSIEMKIKLLGVARASLEELLNDYQDFLRQRNLRIWEPNSQKSQAVRRLVYNRYSEAGQHNSYKNYKDYIKTGESAANCMVCLINQTNRLLDQKLVGQKKNLLKKAGLGKTYLKSEWNTKTEYNNYNYYYIYKNYMNTKNKLEKILGFSLEPTENPEFGDYSSNIAMTMFSNNQKSNFKNPREYAEYLVSKLRIDKGPSLSNVVDKIEVAGPGFINFWLKNDVLIDNLIQIGKEKEEYGKGNSLLGQKYLVEHTSPNPNKALHLGHLRNNVTAMAITNIFEYLGCEVIRDCIDNDRGIAIARLMWGYLKFARKDKKETTDIKYWYEHQDEWNSPKDLGVRPDKFVDELYIKASEDFKNPDIETKVRQMVIDWEAEDKITWELWRKVLEYSYEGQNMTLKRLGNKWDKVWHEHEHYRKGKELVYEGLKKGIFRKGEKGAIVTDLAKYDLPDTVVIKSDGTALYITQDLALTQLKVNTFHPDKIFWVIGPEQTLALKQMYAACEQLGIIKYKDCIHIAFGYMSIKGMGKMSSRKGTVVYIDDLIDQARGEINKILANSSFSAEEKEDISEKVAVGAVKYSVLRVGRLQDTAFDTKESISLDGNSGPYLQYTVARCNSVIAKIPNYKLQITNLNPELMNDEELFILRSLIKFSEVIEDAASKYSPNLLCNYLYDLAQKYNSFYNKFRILEDENKSIRIEEWKSISSFRLALTSATAQVLKNGLKLLGIEAPERM